MPSLCRALSRYKGVGRNSVVPAETIPAVVKIDAVQALVSHPANGPVAAVTEGCMGITGVVDGIWICGVEVEVLMVGIG